MIIKYPLLFIIILVIILIYVFLFKKNITKYTKGTKITNISYLEKTKYYKDLLLKYNITKYIIYFLFTISIISSIILICRPQVKEEDIQEKDIIICMDVSSSVNKSNINLTNTYKHIIKKINNKNIGIIIFNTSSVTLSPLTNDYKYINNILTIINKSIKEENNSDAKLYIRNYINTSSIEDYKEKGTSLIGEGLSSCIYSFTNNKNNKIIIFSTDNNQQGINYINLINISNIAKDKNIKIFSIGTDNINKENKKELIEITNNTNGKYYDPDNNLEKELLNDLNIKRKTKTNYVDNPKLPFYVLAISIIILIIIKKVVLWNLNHLFLYKYLYQLQLYLLYISLFLIKKILLN